MTYQERADKVLAQGCLTYSKRADQFVKGVYPTHVYGNNSGCVLITDNGRSYYDFCGGLGGNLINCENNYTLPSAYEVDLAEKIRGRIPICEKMRFLKTGSEACQAAVRIARAFIQNKSGEDYPRMVFGHGYHGWHNIFISEEYPGLGTCMEHYQKFNLIDELCQYVELMDNNQDTVCAVIVEPVQLDIDVRPLLQMLRDLCTMKGIVLIFDEVITGFRVPKYCVSNYLDVQPDLITFGKALGNGFPLAVIGGRAEIMDTPDYFVSSTFAGEMSAIKAGLRTIDYLTLERLNDLWRRGGEFKTRVNAISKNIQLYGINTKAIWKAADDKYKALFFQEMCKRGFLIGKAWHMLFCHTDRLCDLFVQGMKEVIKLIEDGEVKLEGDLPREVFKRN